jgi:hypothetical protein
MRDIKDSVFLDGRAMLRFEGRTINIAMRDIEKDADFRAFLRELTRAYSRSLEVVRAAALFANRREVQAIAVGGGSSAPFVQELIRRKPPNSAKLHFTPRPATPEWAHAREFRGNLAPVFPQLAIAIGGALAPEGMLAVAPAR